MSTSSAQADEGMEPRKSCRLLNGLVERYSAPPEQRPLAVITRSGGEYLVSVCHKGDALVFAALHLALLLCSIVDRCTLPLLCHRS